jgi:hypothetical protein
VQYESKQTPIKLEESDSQETTAYMMSEPRKSGSKATRSTISFEEEESMKKTLFMIDP